MADSLELLLGGQAAKVGARVISIDPLRGYYQTEGAVPIWTGPRGVSQAAHALIELVAGAEAEGLVPGDYLTGIPDDIDGITDPTAVAGLELALSDMFLHYGRDLYRGRTSPSISAPDIVIARKEFDETAWLRAAAQSGPEAVYHALQPRHAQYPKLKAMLAGYRRLAAAGGWPAVASEETLKPDMTDPGVAELRTNLAARGYGGLARTTAEEAEFFDAGLAAALKHFQDRHGLTADAVVGPRTRTALNVPAEARVRQLIINLERLRWLPADLGERYVFVNQAGFELWAIDAEKVVAEHKVIVGQPFHRSPMFSDRIRYLEFNPTWTVTNSIAVNEMLPKLKQNPNYLATQNMVLYSGWGESAREIDPTAVDWWALAGKQFPFRIVQQPGPKNALGRVKFMFP
ncbi:MAG: L,D-transpeptidase family protein, partial [Hyphomicrobiales bacterium]|nr:L,D-transpeptidase family protein [Hyphomicrobiales bacterium]